MATCFVALPLVIREVVPTLTEIGDDQEQAARSLGANAFQTLWRITLPSIKWAVVYGVVLSLSRSVGEFGAVKVVSGNVTGRTQTATLVVEAKYQGFEQPAAYAVAFLLVGQFAPASFLSHFTVFVLACFVGYMVIWNVTPSLHTPLMSVTNAISSIIAIGALVQVAPPLDELANAGDRPSGLILGLAVGALTLTAVNMFGGFAVTRRMLAMFRK